MKVTAVAPTQDQNSKSRSNLTPTGLPKLEPEEVRAAFHAALKEEKGPFKLSGRGHEPRATIRSHFSKFLSGMHVPSEKLSIGRHYSTFYPLRIVERVAQLLSIETRDLVCTVIRATERNKLQSEADANASGEEDTAEMQDTNGRQFGLPKQPCPKCHSSASVVPIFYGLPIEIPEEVRSGNAVLGGCIDSEENLYCKRCELSFREAKTRYIM